MRQVENIDEDRLADLEEKLAEPTDYTPELCERGFGWQVNLFVPVVSLSEFAKLRKFVGADRFESRVDMIIKGVSRVIPSLAQTVEALTRPTEILTSAARKSRKELMFGRSEDLLKDRHFFRKLVGTYLQADVDKSWIWLPDRHVNGTRLAFGDNAESKAALRGLQRLIETDPAALPDNTRYGKLRLPQISG